MESIYLDYNATSPIDPRVAAAMEPFLRSQYGNPSSSHSLGIKARQAVERARQQIADMLGCAPDEIIFTSGGSESNNLAIKGTWGKLGKPGCHIITSAIEHPSVMEVCRYLERQGVDLTILPVDAAGMVSPDDLEQALRPETILVSIMHANNEVGTIEPIAELAAIARSRKIRFHTDCAQSVGKIPVRVAELGADMLSIAGHKLYAPKGIGVLYLRRGLELEKLIHGADHESNQRAGTENVLEIVGLGKACELVTEEIDSAANHLSRLRDRFESNILEALPETQVNGHREQRLPNTASMSFPRLEANTILDALDGVMASAGAACHAEHVELSAVLEAMALPLETAMGTIRFSMGRMTTAAEVDAAAAEVVRVVRGLQPENVEQAQPVIMAGEVRLTQFTHGLGCACKLRPQLLEKALQDIGIEEMDQANVLIGPEGSDDAAVYRLSPDRALVQTVDFFTPVVDDPYQFGAIAAANSLSDIYAMGARPLFALNVVGFPSQRLPVEVLQQILRGAADKAREAGIPILGGHTVDDTEPKFGLVVSGEVHPDRLWRNQGGKAGDALILTKALGTGVLSTALKRGLLETADAQRLMEQMATLNGPAAEVLASFDIHAATDVTGFGLLGHLLEMVRDSDVGADVEVAKLPILPRALELIRANVIPGGTRDNAAYTDGFVSSVKVLDPAEHWLLNDAQTSGGLLVALPQDVVEKALDQLRGNGVEGVCIGHIQTEEPGRIRII